MNNKNKKYTSYDNLFYLTNNTVTKNNYQKIKLFEKYNDMPFAEQSVVVLLKSSESEFLSDSDTKIFNEAITESKRKTKSYNNINIYDNNNVTTTTTQLNNVNHTPNNNNCKDIIDDEIIDKKIQVDGNPKSDESTEKTEDLIAQALKVALEEKKEFYRKTDLDQEDQLSYEGEKEYDNSDSMMMPMSSPHPPGVVTDAQGLIVPKKLTNPCLESSHRKDLHRELLFNQKVGKNVLNQKSELQRALEKQKEKQLQLQRKLQEQEQEPGIKDELSRVIMERQQKLEKKNTQNQDDEISSQLNPEYLTARAKLRARIDTK